MRRCQGTRAEYNSFEHYNCSKYKTLDKNMNIDDVFLYNASRCPLPSNLKQMSLIRNWNIQLIGNRAPI